MSWLSDYIAKRRQARAELYKDRPWMTHGYWLAVIAGTLAMLYGYSRAVDYYFFTESADAAYFKNAIAEGVLAGKETLYLRDLIPYKEEFETACFVTLPAQKDPTEYMTLFKGHPVEDIPWHLRLFLVLKGAESERTITFKSYTINTPPLLGTIAREDRRNPARAKLQNKLQLSRTHNINAKEFYDCIDFATAGINVSKNEAQIPYDKSYKTVTYSLSPIQKIRGDTQ